MCRCIACVLVLVCVACVCVCVNDNKESRVGLVAAMCMTLVLTSFPIHLYDLECIHPGPTAMLGSF